MFLFSLFFRDYDLESREHLFFQLCYLLQKNSQESKYEYTWHGGNQHRRRPIFFTAIQRLLLFVLSFRACSFVPLSNSVICFHLHYITSNLAELLLKKKKIWRSRYFWLAKTNAALPCCGGKSYFWSNLGLARNKKYKDINWKLI